MRFSLAALLLLCFAAPADAAAPPYEDALVARALRRTGLTPDPAPAGKRIGRVVLLRYGIVDHDDPWPRWLNLVHVTTRERVIRQELLLHAGERYDAALVAESERNLRALPILAVARLVPCQGAQARAVDLLVVVKDLWSLRLNMVFGQTGSLLSTLDFMPTEENLLGRYKRLSLHVTLSQLELALPLPFPLVLFSTGRVLRDRLVLGEAYFDRRLLGSRLRLLQQVDLRIEGRVPCGGSVGQDPAADPRLWCPSRATGTLSGVLVRLRLDQPLYSLAAPWGFHVDAWVDDQTVRAYRQHGPTVDARLPPGERPGLSLETVSWSGHPDGRRRNVPYVYEQRRLVASTGVVRSFGRGLRQDLGWGLLAYRLAYSPPDGFPFDERTRRWFGAATLPRSESAAAFYLRYGTRPTRFVRQRNVRGFALTEDFALGPALGLELRAAQNLVDAAQAFGEGFADLRWRWQLSDQLLTLTLGATARLQGALAPADDAAGDAPLPATSPRAAWVNQRMEAGVHHVAGRWGWGRLHSYASLVLRRDDLDRGVSRLGGAGDSVRAPDGNPPGSDHATLRGYPSSAYAGRNLLRLHSEYRTLPAALWTVHLGGVLFYDGGSAWGSPSPGRLAPAFRWHHSAGIGLRAVLPQFDRDTLRIDLGLPLERDAPGSAETWLSFSYGQAF
ncbi:MAG: BamA/TamA family outer membrane protein [Proteobacteria bacterium]|nr:BamA/TamA family outer membrane protein [Pseudomonadota bacterium]